MVSAGSRGTARTLGTYAGVRVSPEFGQQVISLHRQGVGTVRARAILREAGFRFRDSAFNAVRNEAVRVETRGLGLGNLRMDARAGASTLVRTNREFSTNYQYTTRVQLIDPITGQVSELPVSFGDNRALTRREVIERAEAIAEQVSNKGGVGSDVAGIAVGSVRWTGAMARAPR